MTISCKRYTNLIPFHAVAFARRIGRLQAAATVSASRAKHSKENTRNCMYILTKRTRTQPTQATHVNCKARAILDQITIMTKVVTGIFCLLVLEEIKKGKLKHLCFSRYT